jgi:transcription elongation factor GreA
MVQTPTNGPRQGSPLGQLLSEYLTSAGATLQPTEVSALRRFLNWCGFKTPADQVRPQHIVEFFQSQNTSLPLQPRPYLTLIKNFFAFAEAQGAVTQNPASKVVLPRQPKSADVGSRAARRAQRPAPEAVYLTRAKYEEMQEELRRLKQEERPRIARLIEIARKDGDLRENAAYHDAKERQGQLEARIRELETKLKLATIIDEQVETNGAKEVVDIGARVVLQDLKYGGQTSYYLVGPDEARPAEGKISFRSPVGRSLMGKRAGDEVEVVTPGGTVRYRILEVGYGTK